MNIEDVRLNGVKLDKITFTSHRNDAYQITVHWKKNLILLPTGMAGKHY